MKFIFYDKKLVAQKLRKKADELDPPRVESRKEKMLLLANAKPFEDEEATQIISKIAEKSKTLVVIL